MLTTIADLRQEQETLSPLLQLATSLSDRYGEYLESAEEDIEGEERKPGIHASELGCKRRVFYTLLGAKKNRAAPKKWRQRFEVGKAIHRMVQDHFYKMADQTEGRIHFAAEVPVSAKYQPIAKRLQLESRCDGVFTFYPEREEPYQYTPPVLRVGLEIKTESPDSWESLKGPREEHIEQAHLYMKALDLPLMWFYYFNKGNQNHTLSSTPWLLAYNEAVWQKVEETCEQLLTMADYYPYTGVLPERTEKVWCEFCPYRGRELCNPEYLSKRAARTFQPRAVRV